MKRFFFGVVGVLIAAVAFGQIRNSAGALITPQLTGNASDVLKGDGTVGPGGGGESVPAGAILLIKSGTCPTGYTEESDLDGKTLIGTLAAHGDVGTTGGSDTITQVLNHTHPVTDPGHTHNQGLRNSGTAGTAGIQGASTANNATITNGVPSATTGITTANPAGGVANIDNRSAFLKVIFCRKT